MIQIDEQESLSITMVCLNAAGVVFRRSEKNIGGMEIRAWTLARALAECSQTRVMFVVRDVSTTSPAIEGVQVQPFESQWSRAVSELSPYLTRRYSFPWAQIRRWSPRLVSGIAKIFLLKMLAAGEKQSSFETALSNTNGDVFIGFGVSYYTKYMIEAARKAKKPSVVMIAWDGDLDERNRPGSGYVSQFGDRGEDTWWILKNADQIVVQTPTQQAMLKERFGRESILLLNPIDLEYWQQPSMITLPDDVQRAAGAWLWVGRCERYHKQPQLLIKLAKECPQERFLMILNPRDNELEAEIRRDCPSNVTIVESVPYESMAGVYQRSKGLISTSSQEGFPNTFLQSAACGKPIVSLNVADDFLRESEAGTCSNGDWDLFIQSLKSPPQLSSKTSIYLREHYHVDTITARFHSLLEALKRTNQN